VSERPVRAYIGLGANVGNAVETLAAAVRALATLPGARLQAVSRLYRTRPVGVTDQPDFHNAVVELRVSPGSRDAAADALSLLERLKDLERDFGRRRRGRWGPRELDLDLLVFGRSTIDVERTTAARSLDAAKDPAAVPDRLVVPHPAARERLFVLAPLADVAPRLVPPGWNTTVETARRELVAREKEGAVIPVASWDERRDDWGPLQPR
jgi:2-amino-4-hydroxy-6-hydroxymethyldihydropteridine diphosphokinase